MELEQTVSKDVLQSVTIHVNWYEDIYKYYHSINYVTGKLRSMAGKERLLGMTGGNKIVINKRTQINIQHKEVVYDESRLTIRERERKSYLMNKMKW